MITALELRLLGTGKTSRRSLSRAAHDCAIHAAALIGWLGEGGYSVEGLAVAKRPTGQPHLCGKRSKSKAVKGRSKLFKISVSHVRSAAAGVAAHE